MTARVRFESFIGSRVWRLIAEHNPFYLLSAACMLAGCLALTNSLSWTSISLPRLLVLIVTLNVYEAALLGLAVVLIAGRGLLRDGRMLIVLQLVFLIDVSFLNTELATLKVGLGMIVNAMLFVLALVKLRVVLKVLRPAVTRGEVASMIAQLVVLFALPCVLRRIDHGSLSPVDFYAVWWVLGLLPVVHAVFAQALPEDFHGRAHETSAVPVKAYVSLPWVSILLHVSILHYVYDVTFYGAMAAPVLLGLAVALKRAEPTKFVSIGELRFLRVALPILALWVSAGSPRILALPVFGVSLTTAKIAFVGFYLTYVYLFFMQWARYLLGGGAIAAATVMFGPSVSQIVSFGDSVLQTIFDAIGAIIPKSASQWGVVGVVCSFLFLAVGAAVSLLRPPPAIEVKTDVPVQDG